MYLSMIVIADLQKLISLLLHYLLTSEFGIGKQVSYSLLIFFCGMFITVDGFNRTGIPSALWDFMEPHAQINSAGGTALLSLVIIVLSNIASNVPTGKLFSTKFFLLFF